LDAATDTVHWGFFAASLTPVMTVDPGETVTISTVNGLAYQLPDPDRFGVPPVMREIHEKVERKFGAPHILTGPVAINGARAGQVLEVRIQQIDVTTDWAYNIARPQAGGLPDDFHRPRLTHIPIDRDRMIGTMPWGAEIPLRPFFGVMGVAPPPAWGEIASPPPRRNGGNMDNKELTAGSTLFLPIHVDGALFSCGDGHAAQGDGEVCLTALEVGLEGTFEFHLRDDLPLDWPMAETPSHLVTMAFHPDLDDAAEIALRNMIAQIAGRVGISSEDAYMLCSVAADVRVTQIVNGNKGIHIVLDKRYLVPAR
jgi:acetamidase/formamidase